jgi:hypothetical protein
MAFIRPGTSDPRAGALQSPIFLIGSERSGTTLLRLMLDHHPDIAFNLESEFLVSEISATGVFPDVAGYRHKLKDNRVFAHSRFDVREDLDFPALARDFLRQKLERDRKRIVGATVHYGFGKLRYLWPGARYIYLLRDGRAVACSVVEMGWAGNVFSGANWWLEAEREWAELRESLPPERWLELRYEDLIAGSGAQLQRVCDFIGVSFSERMFDYTEDSSYSLPNPAQSLRWRRKIAPRDLELLEARIGSRLTARGYELSCVAPPRIDPVRAKWLHWQSRLKVLAHKVDTYGFRLFASELVSRRLGWKSAQRRALRAINLIEDRNLK